MLIEILYGPFHADLWEKEVMRQTLRLRRGNSILKTLKIILIFVQEFRSLYWVSNNRGLEVEL